MRQHRHNHDVTVRCSTNRVAVAQRAAGALARTIQTIGGCLQPLDDLIEAKLHGREDRNEDAEDHAPVQQQLHRILSRVRCMALFGGLRRPHPLDELASAGELACQVAVRVDCPPERRD